MSGTVEVTASQLGLLPQGLDTSLIKDTTTAFGVELSHTFDAVQLQFEAQNQELGRSAAVDGMINERDASVDQLQSQRTRLY